MGRELKFNLSIDSTALLCPNPQEFYAKAYLTSDVADNYRTIPGIKYKTEIVTTTFTNILKPSSCDFAAGTETLGPTIAIDVKAVSALGQICKFDLETSFLSAQMAKGSGASFEVQPYMNFYWDIMAKQIEQEIEYARWQGSYASSGTTYLQLVDGYEKLLLADSNVLDVTLTAITTSNVLTAMAAVYNKMATSAPQVSLTDPNLRIYVAPNVAAAYRAAVAAGNTNSYVTQNLDLTYLGIKIVIAQGMSANKMVMTLKDNMIYGFDGMDDSKNIKAIDLSDSVAEPKLRSRVDLKLAFQIANGAEIVYYN